MYQDIIDKLPQDKLNEAKQNGIFEGVKQDTPSRAREKNKFSQNELLEQNGNITR